MVNPPRTILKALLSASARPLPWALLLFAGGLMVSWHVADLERRADLVWQRVAVQGELEILCGEISREFYGTLHLTEGLAGLISTDGGITEEHFHTLAGELLRRTDRIRNIAVAPGNVIRMTHPVEGNEMTLGLDYRTMPSQWPGVERMMREGRLMVAGPVELVQGGIGVIGRSPVYAKPAEGGSTVYWGLVSTVIEFDKLLAATCLAELTARLEVAMRGVDGRGADGEVFWGEAGVFRHSPVLATVALPSGGWQVAAVPRGGWPVASQLRSPEFLSGAFLSSLLACLLFGLLRTATLREREVEYRRSAEASLRVANCELERARADLERRVAERTRELEAANRELDSFCYSVSHDLRTPLRGIAGFAQLLSESKAVAGDEEGRRHLDRIQAAAGRMGELIDDLLQLSRMTREDSRHGPVNLSALANEVVHSLRLENPAREVEVILPEGLEVRGDLRLLKIVLENLIGNAWKFTSRRAHARIELGTESRSSGPVYFVRDNGAGFDMRYAEKLFAPFQRLHRSVEFPGSGVGLATVQRIIHRHGGQVWAEAAVGRGATVFFTLNAD